MKICVQDGGIRERIGDERCYKAIAEAGFTIPETVEGETIISLT